MRMRTVTATVLAAAAMLGIPTLAQASSHREAPFITKNPKVDGTDFYMFNSYDPAKPGFVTIIANYQPLQDAYGGPNYFPLDPDALYEIMIDNTGDGVEDLTFQFQFSQALVNAGQGLCIGGTGAACTGGQSVSVPFLNVGDIRTAANLNVDETYTINLVTGPRRTGTVKPITNGMGTASFTKPADYVGPKSYGAGITTGANTGGATAATGAANYAAYANSYISNITIPGCTTAGQVFVGQRAEGFPVNLGTVFDLLDVPAAVITNGLVDNNAIPFANTAIAAKNITSIALNIPTNCITSTGGPVIGGWTTASVRQARVVNPAGTFATPTVEGGAWTQVSRLGMPLVNELVVGLKDKDAFNAAYPPSGDAAPFGVYIEYPTLPKIIDIIYGTMFEPALPRLDLVEVFAQGVPGVNVIPTGNDPDSGAPTPAEMLRLNTTTSGIFAPRPAGMQNVLGAALCFVHGTLTPGNAGCDPTGFPNGRRPGDDVVDIVLDVAEGYLLANTPAFPATGTSTFFTDGVEWTATNFQSTFPYMNPPIAGANGDATFAPYVSGSALVP